ncbi:MAG TPA: phage tail tape measure protein [Methanospirillum sp.]|nr:phage tail tape measure protein [Methanospirillum sp.]
MLGAGLTAAALPAETFVKDSISTYKDYESQIQYVSSLLGNQKGIYEELDQTAKKLGADTPFSAIGVAEAMQPLAQAGYSLDQIKEVTPTLINMAVATREPLSEMSSTLTQTLAQFQMLPDQAETVGDKIATAANISNTDVRDISESLKYAGTTAQAFNKPLDDILAVLSTLGDFGVKGSMAGTGINEFLARLEEPPKAAKKALQEYGIALDAIKPSTHSFEEIIETLVDSGMDIGSFIKLLGLEAGPKFAALFSTEGLDKYRGKLKTLQSENKGTLQKLTDEQMGTLSNIIETIKGNLQNISLSVGKKFKPLFSSLKSWFEENKDTLSVFAQNLVNGIIPVIEKVFAGLSKVMNWFNSLPKDMQSKVGSLAGVGTALAAIAGPVLLLASSPLAALEGLFGILQQLSMIKELDKKAQEISLLADAINSLSSSVSVTSGSKSSTKAIAETIADDAALAAIGIGDAGNALLLAADKYDDDVKKVEEKIEKTKTKPSTKSVKSQVVKAVEEATDTIAPALFAGGLYGADAIIDYEKPAPSRHYYSKADAAADTGALYGLTNFGASKRGMDSPGMSRFSGLPQYDDAISEMEKSEDKLRTLISQADDEVFGQFSTGDASNLALAATQLDDIGESAKKTGKSLKEDFTAGMDEWSARSYGVQLAEEADKIDEVGEKAVKSTGKLSRLTSGLSSLLGFGGTAAVAGDLAAIEVAAGGAGAEVATLGSSLAVLGGPVGAAAIVAVAGGLAAYATNLGDFRNNINSILTDLGSAGSNISTGNYELAGRNCAYAFGSGLETIGDLALGLVDPQTWIKVGDFLQGGIDASAAMARGLGQGLRDQVDILGPMVMSSLSSSFQNGMSYLSGVGAGILSTIQDGANPTSIGTWIMEQIGNGLNSAKISISGLWATIQAAYQSGDWLSLGADIGKKIGNGVLQTFKKINPIVGPAVENLIGGYLEGTPETNTPYKNPAKTGSLSWGGAGVSGSPITGYSLPPITSPSTTSIADELIKRGYSSELANDPDSAKTLAKTLGIDTTSASKASSTFTISAEQNAGALDESTSAVKAQKASIEDVISASQDWEDASRKAAKAGYSELEALKAWNNKDSEGDGSSDESDKISSVNDDQTESTKKKTKSVEKVIKSFDASVSKDEALSQILDEFGGSIDAAKKAVADVKIGDKTYNLGTTDGNPVLKAANDYTKASEKAESDLLKGIGVIEKFSSGTSIQDAINKTIDKYGTDYQGQIDVGGNLYNLGKKATGSYDAEGMADEWSFYLKGANDKAKAYLETLDNISTGEYYKSGAKKGQIKTKEMSTDEWAKNTGVIRKSTDGTQNAIKETEKYSNAASSAATGIIKFSDAYDASGKKTETLSKSTDTANDSLNSLSDSVGTIDLQGQFEALFDTVDLKAILEKALDYQADLGVGKLEKDGSNAAARQQIKDDAERMLYSSATNEGLQYINFAKYAGQSLSDAFADGGYVDMSIKKAYLQNTVGQAGGFNPSSSMTWDTNAYMNKFMNPEAYAAIDAIKKTLIPIAEGVYSGSITASGNDNTITGTKWGGSGWEAKYTEGVKGTETATKQAVSVFKSFSEALAAFNMDSAKATHVMRAYNDASKDLIATNDEARQYMALYNQANGQNTEFTRENIIQTRSLMQATMESQKLQEMYAAAIKEGGVDSEEAKAINAQLSLVNQDLAAAGITATSGLSGLPSSLQSLAAYAQSAVSQINAAIASANAAVNEANNYVTRVRNLSGKYQADSPGVKMPQYATGGEVEKTGPAIVHQGEFVLNRNDVNDLKRPQAATQLLQISQHIDLRGSMVDRNNVQDLDKLFYRSQKRALGRIGAKS